jgi:FkbH-like protein
MELGDRTRGFHLFESEVNERFESADNLDPSILARFAETRRGIGARSLIFWGEHCSECAMPGCYVSCEFYRPRADLRCRRFTDGMARVDYSASTLPYLLKVRFKRWGKLMGWGSGRLLPLIAANGYEHYDRLFAWALRTVPLPFQFRARAMRYRYGQKKRRALRGGSSGPPPTSFLVECHNPSPESVYTAVTISTVEGDASFHARIEFEPGYNAVRLAASEIAESVSPDAPFTVQIIPESALGETHSDTTLYFGAIEFVYEAKSQSSTPLVKCVVWDLDNTLWRGTLVEDGLQKLEIDEDLAEVIRELDRRGVLHSIASKNDEGPAREALRHFGLDDYFLFPQISWSPKSGAVEQIAASLGIARDTLLFVDDSAFERAEVRASHPDVRIIDARDAHELPKRRDLRGPVTSDSVQRRQRYRDEQRRDSIRSEFEGDRFEFLQNCRIELNVAPLSEVNLDRVHELAQRTNQLNFSGNRYDRQALSRILDAPSLDTHVVQCRDRFGDYGIVGFALVDRRESILTDLMFSCRVRGRRVEHALLCYLVNRYREAGCSDFRARYRRTERNAVGGCVFDDLEFENRGSEDGVDMLVLPSSRALLDDHLIEIHEHEVQA